MLSGHCVGWWAPPVSSAAASSEKKRQPSCAHVGCRPRHEQSCTQSLEENWKIDEAASENQCPVCYGRWNLTDPTHWSISLWQIVPLGNSKQTMTHEARSIIMPRYSDRGGFLIDIRDDAGKLIYLCRSVLLLTMHGEVKIVQVMVRWYYG